jgi:hypothetical protein
MALTLAEILGSPDHYLHALDGEDAVFVPMDRAAYHRSIFLDGRISAAAAGSMRLPVSALARHVAPPAQTGWIFHVAHCGSTLLARALDVPEHNLVLREPLALRQVALAPDPARLAFVAAMLGKRYQPDAPTIVKANVPVNFILDELIARDPSAPAIFLYLDLRDYVLAILRSAEHRAWLQRVTQQLAGHLGDLSGLGDGERAAALWLAQVRAYARALDTLPGGRSLNAERFFAEPASVLAAAARYFAVPIDAAAADTITHGPLFTTYSKNPAVSFDNAARVSRREALEAGLADEIAAGQDWVARQGSQAADAMRTLAGAALEG